MPFVTPSDRLLAAPARARLCAWIALVLLVAAGGRAWSQTDESLQIFSQDALFTIQLNGITVATEPGTDPFAGAPSIAQLLHNGTNQISVSWHPLTVTLPEAPYLQLAFIQSQVPTTVGGTPTSTTIWSLVLPAGKDVGIGATEVSDGTLLKGSFNATLGDLTWIDYGGTSIWSLRMSAADAYNTIPATITLAPSVSVTSAAVTFANAGGTHVVTYSGIALSPGATGAGEASVNLSSRTPSAGTQWLGQTDFSVITVSYPTAQATSELVSTELTLTQGPPRNVDQTYSFQLTLDPTKVLALNEIATDWQKLTSLSTADATAIRNVIGQLQSALASKSTSAVQNVIGYYMSLDARLRAFSPTVYTQNMLGMLTAGPFADPKLVLTPLNTRTLVLTIAPSGRSVHVTRADGTFAIQSSDDGSGHFNMDVYAGKVTLGGKTAWTIGQTNDVLP